LLDDGLNQSATAAAVRVSESAVRYAIKMGYLKKAAVEKANSNPDKRSRVTQSISPLRSNSTVRKSLSAS